MHFLVVPITYLNGCRFKNNTTQSRALLIQSSVEISPYVEDWANTSLQPISHIVCACVCVGGGLLVFSPPPPPPFYTHYFSSSSLIQSCSSGLSLMSVYPYGRGILLEFLSFLFILLLTIVIMLLLLLPLTVSG